MTGSASSRTTPSDSHTTTATSFSSTTVDTSSTARDASTLSESSFKASRDRYGFKKQSHYVSAEQYDAWWADYKPYLTRRKRKWVRLMRDSGLAVPSDGTAPARYPPRSEKLKRYIRKGIPAEWRGNAWWFFAKGPEKMAENKGVYERLVAKSETVKSKDTELIERDLHRTFPDNVYYKPEVNEGESGMEHDESKSLIPRLRSVLRAFALYMPKVGYCQSLNFIAGLMLLFMDEERAFWMLVIITQRYLPGVHDLTLEGVNTDQGVLMLLLRDSMPRLWDKLGVSFDGEHYPDIITKLPPITLITASWFMSAYITIFPIETVLRIWDSFIFEDSKIIFRVALTIFKLSEPSLEGLKDPMDLFQAVQNTPKKIVDPATVMETCFKRRNGIGHVGQDEVRRLRDLVRQKRRASNLKSEQGDISGEDDIGDIDDSAFHIGAGKTARLHGRMRSLRLSRVR